MSGNWVNLGTTLQSYQVRTGYTPLDIVGIQGSSTTDVKAYYSASVGAQQMASRGSLLDLAAHPTDSLRTVSYPVGYGPDDVAGMVAKDSSDDVFTYFKDGLVSRGTWVSLASIEAPQSYEIDKYYVDDIEGNELFRGETVGAAYREWLETPLARWGGADYELARATCAFKAYDLYGGARRYDPWYRILTAFQNGITYEDIGWEFDYRNADGWTGENATFTLNDGDVLVTSISTDPQMISPPIRFFPSAALASTTQWQFSKAGTEPDSRCKSAGVEQLSYTKVALTLSAPTPLPGNQISVFWDNGEGFSAANSLNFTADVSTTPTTFVKNLAAYAAWTKGIITRLRIDPTSSTSKVRVHSIRLLR